MGSTPGSKTLIYILDRKLGVKSGLHSQRGIDVLLTNKISLNLTANFVHFGSKTHRDQLGLCLLDEAIGESAIASKCNATSD